MARRRRGGALYLRRWPHLQFFESPARLVSSTLTFFNAGQVEYNRAGVLAFLRGFLIRGENYMVFKRFYSLLFSRRGFLILACVLAIFAMPTARESLRIFAPIVSVAPRIHS